jgi:hypothetical protein
VTRRPLLAAARVAGTAIRITRRPARTALRALPGVAGAAAVAVGLGEVAGHYQRGLTWWVACVIGGVFALGFAREINAAPPAPRQEDE